MNEKQYKEVLKVLRDLRIKKSDRDNYCQSYANGHTDAIIDAMLAVKKMDYEEIQTKYDH